MDNRWAELASATNQEQVPATVETVVEETVTVLRGASQPQQGLASLRQDDGRLVRFLTDAQEVFWLGAHGGAGETILAELLGGMACHHRWPLRPADGQVHAPAQVFFVARQNRRGLDAVSRVARDWASGAHPDVQLHGLVLMADAPGKTPKNLVTQTRVVSGGVPRTWVVPWIEELRLRGAADWESLAREPRKVLTALGEVVDEINSERTSR